MGSVILELKQICKTESGVNQYIAKTILENLEVINNMQIKEIAKLSFTSPTTITRFSQKLNYQGWVELKLDIKNALLNSSNNQIMSCESNVKEIVDWTAESIFNSLKRAHQTVDLNALDKVVNCISNAGSIYVYAQGGTYFVANDFANRLQRINIQVFCSNDFAFQKVQAHNAKDNDLFLLLSYSGKSQNIIEIAKILKERNIKTISITKIGNNTLQQYTDINLKIAEDSTHIRNIVSSSRMNMLFITELIYYLIFKKNEKVYTELLYKTMKG